jgi:hypothetical protein
MVTASLMVMGTPPESWFQPSVIVPPVTTALGIIAAWIGYLTVKRGKISDMARVDMLISPVPRHIVSFTDSSVRTSTWNVRLIKWVLGALSIGLAAASFSSPV